MAPTDSIGALGRADTLSPATLPSPTPCRPWCEHDGRFPTVHESAVAQLPAPMGLDVGRGELLTARIAVDDDFVERPEIVIGHAGDGLALAPERALAFAASLMAFAAEIHTLARAASPAA